jgi:hypothetical protein
MIPPEAGAGPLRPPATAIGTDATVRVGRRKSTANHRGNTPLAGARDVGAAIASARSAEKSAVIDTRCIILV